MSARRRALTLIERRDARALVLTRPGGVNWRSGGLSDPIDLTASSDPVWSVDTPEGSALVTSEIEAPRLERDFRVSELGWELLSVPWYDSSAALRAACEFAGCAPEEMISDAGVGADAYADVVSARLALEDAERDDLRELGAVVGRALADGIEAWTPGVSTDYDVAAVVSAALVSQGAAPVCLIVGGDERLRRLRHPLAVGDVVREALMVVVVARRAGLHAAATRVSVARADDEIVARVSELEPIEVAVLAASHAGGTWGETIESLEGAYASAGHAGAWREHFQGGPIGYEQREFELAPGQSESPYWHLTRRVGTAVAWNPSLAGGGKVEDTYLVGENALELVTPSAQWPTNTGGTGHGVLIKADR